MPKLSRSENRNKWIGIVEAYHQSDLNKEVFCIEQQVKASTLDYWIRKMRIQNAPSNVAKSGFASLVPKLESSDEARIHIHGVDLYVRLNTEPQLLKTFLLNLFC